MSYTRLKAFLISFLALNLILFVGIALSLFFPKGSGPFFVLFMAASIPSAVFLTYQVFTDASLTSFKSYLRFLFNFDLLNIAYLAVLFVIVGIAYFPIRFVGEPGSALSNAVVVVCAILMWPVKKKMSRYYFRAGLYTFKSLNKDLDIRDFISKNKVAERLWPELGANQGYLVTRFPSAILILGYSFTIGLYFILVLGSSEQYASFFSFIQSNSNIPKFLFINALAAGIMTYTCQKISVYVEKLDELLESSESL